MVMTVGSNPTKLNFNNIYMKQFKYIQKFNNFFTTKSKIKINSIFFDSIQHQKLNKNYFVNFSKDFNILNTHVKNINKKNKKKNKFRKINKKRYMLNFIKVYKKDKFIKKFKYIKKLLKKTNKRNKNLSYITYGPIQKFKMLNAGDSSTFLNYKKKILLNSKTPVYSKIHFLLPLFSTNKNKNKQNNIFMQIEKENKNLTPLKNNIFIKSYLDFLFYEFYKKNIFEKEYFYQLQKNLIYSLNYYYKFLNKISILQSFIEKKKIKKKFLPFSNIKLFKNLEKFKKLNYNFYLIDFIQFLEVYKDLQNKNYKIFLKFYNKFNIYLKKKNIFCPLYKYSKSYQNQLQLKFNKNYISFFKYNTFENFLKQYYINYKLNLLYNTTYLFLFYKNTNKIKKLKKYQLNPFLLKKKIVYNIWFQNKTKQKSYIYNF